MLKALFAFAGWLALGGQVRDAVTHEPVAGVLVQVVGTADSTRTDAAGRWFLADAAAGARVRFSRRGYAPVDRVLADTAETVELAPAAQMLERQTVTAIRAGGDAPIAQRTVARSDIETRYFGQDVTRLLEVTPSVTTYAETGGYAGYNYLRLRGIDQTRLNITFDGVPLNDPEDQVLYFSNFPDFGNSVETVQVQRGVGTSTNGTAAYAGSVNFESIALASTARRGELQLTRGSFDTWRGSAEYATGLTPSRFAAYGRASGLSTANYRRHAGNDAGSGFFSAGYFGDRTIAKLTAFAGRSKTDLAYYASSKEELALDPRANPLTPEEKDDFWQGFAGLTVTRLLGEGASWATTAYHVSAGGDYDVRFDSATLANFGLRHGVTGLLSTASLRRGALALDVGAHGNTYARDHFMAIRPDLDARLYTNTGHKREASGFAKARWAPGPVALFGDLQLRTARFRYEPDANAGIGERSIDWSFANPKVGATWQVSRALAAFASYGRTGREPARSDMFAGADNLDSSNAASIGPLSRVRPEYVNDAELGVHLRGRHAALQANLFDMRFHDEIAPIGQLSVIGTPLRKNVDRSWRRGLELDAEAAPLPQLVASATFAYTRARIASYTDDASGATFRDVEPLLTPRVTSNQQLRWRAVPSLTLTLGGRYVGKSFLANTGDRHFMTPAFWLADAGAIVRVAGQELLVQVNNLADDKRAYTGGYTDGTTSYYYLSAPRNIMVTARLGF